MNPKKIEFDKTAALLSLQLAILKFLLDLYLLISISTLVSYKSFFLSIKQCFSIKQHLMKHKFNINIKK